MLASVDPTFKYYFCLHANETLLRLEHTPKLVIAAINGHCVGGGLEIAMAADMRIARKDAGKIGLPEVNLGVLPGTGGTQRLSRLVGKSKAIELMITGNTFSFEEAQEFGIINDIFERDGFMENIMEYARQFCSAEQSREGRGPHQARGADGLGDSDGIGAGRGARESADSVPERRRQRRAGRLCGEASGGVHGEVVERRCTLCGTGIPARRSTEGSIFLGAFCVSAVKGFEGLCQAK
jgi:enoyl-CoA hydratase/carnithine racemase